MKVEKELQVAWLWVNWRILNTFGILRMVLKINIWT